MCFFLDLLVLTCNISLETCAYVLLSWYAVRGEALRPPPYTPPPAFMFKPVPLATYYSFVFSQASSFIWAHFIFVDIHQDLCLYSWYALRGEALRPPPCTPLTRFYFLTGSPCYLLCFLFFKSIIVYLTSFYLYCCPCRLVPMYFFHVLSWYALQGTPPPAFVFSSASLATYCLAFCS